MRVLREFPRDGVCWNPSQELRKFLAKRVDQKFYSITSKGVAWSAVSFWPVETSSGKPEYKLEQLKPFFIRKWALRTTIENSELVHQFLIKHKNEWEDYRADWAICETGGAYFHYPPLESHAHSSTRVSDRYEEITFEEFKKISGLEEPFPEKWCIRWGNKANYEVIQGYLHTLNDSRWHYTEPHHSSGLVDYQNKYYGFYCEIPEGLTEITFEQFKKHVLTNNITEKIKENGPRKTEKRTLQKTSECCILRRTNLEIRQGDSIRAVSFRCSKSKIRIGS